MANPSTQSINKPQDFSRLDVAGGGLFPEDDEEETANPGPPVKTFQEYLGEFQGEEMEGEDASNEEEMDENVMPPDETKIFQTIADENLITDPRLTPIGLAKIFKYIDDNEEKFVQNLREAVGIQSISVLPEARIECFRMIQFAAEKLRGLGFELELRKVGAKPLNGSAEEVALPPVILGTRGYDPNKKTVLFYGHLDVLPAKREDGWSCEPFYLVEEGECLYGRGASDDKGPIMGWFHAVEAYVRSSIRVPVNVKVILESMSETGSEGLDSLLIQQRKTFLKDVDVIVMSDSYWLGKTKPCLGYGLRGLCYFFLEVEMGSKDLHSGVYGGTVREAMPDLLWLMNQLVDADGTILVPGIMDNVCPLLPEEEELYKDVDFDLDWFQEDAGFKGLRFPENKDATLMNRWRFPALSIHGIQGAWDRPGAKVVIPRKVIGKFSIRIVPNQDPEMVEQQVKTYLKARWEERKSPNKMLIYMADEGLKPWCANPFHPSFRAARQAVCWAYQTIPDMIREGGSLEKLLAFQEATEKNVILIPMGSCDDRAHSTNEKINRNNYISGTKVFASFLFEVGRMDGMPHCNYP